MQTMRIEGKWYWVKPMTKEEMKETVCNVCGGTGYVEGEPIKAKPYQIGEQEYGSISFISKECPNPFCKAKYTLKI